MQSPHMHKTRLRRVSRSLLALFSSRSLFIRHCCNATYSHLYTVNS